MPSEKRQGYLRTALDLTLATHCRARCMDDEVDREKTVRALVAGLREPLYDLLTETMECAANNGLGPRERYQYAREIVNEVLRKGAQE